MIIGIDGNEANISDRVGVGRYAVELLNQFSQLTANDLCFTIYLKEKPKKHLPIAKKGWQYKVVGPGRLWTQIGLPVALFLEKEKPTVFFSPTHYAPRFSPSSCVISIMDLSYLHYPEMFRKNDLYQLRNWTLYSVRKAKKILTISQASKADIIKYYGIDSTRVLVTYPGNIKAKTKVEATRLKDKYGIQGEYILYVGTLQPRKNLIRLIEAFYKVKNQAIKLVVVGKKGWMYEEIFTQVKKLGIEKEVLFTGFVPDEDLPIFYQKAKCLALVSLYEGFGLPVLEAMSYGTPVVVSKVSSLPEIAGEAGILVEPGDTDNIAQGILKILEMNERDYQQLSEKCKKQAAKFNWEKTARETLKVLKEVANANNH